MLRSCPAGHALSKNRNKEAHLRCDGVCGTITERDSWLWSCAKCDFDLCVSCAHRIEPAAKGTPSTATEEVRTTGHADGELDDVKRDMTWETWGQSPTKRAKEMVGRGGRRIRRPDQYGDDEPEPKRRSPRKPEPTYEEFTPTPAMLAGLVPPVYYEARVVPLVEPMTGAPLTLDLPELPAVDDPVLLASLQAKRRWLLQLWQLELRRELIDESATYVLQPESPAPSDEEARAARVQLCMAKFERERSDLLASEQLLLGQ